MVQDYKLAWIVVATGREEFMAGILFSRQNNFHCVSRGLLVFHFLFLKA